MTTKFISKESKNIVLAARVSILCENPVSKKEVCDIMPYSEIRSPVFVVFQKRAIFVVLIAIVAWSVIHNVIVHVSQYALVSK